MLHKRRAKNSTLSAPQKAVFYLYFRTLFTLFYKEPLNPKCKITIKNRHNSVPVYSLILHFSSLIILNSFPSSISQNYTARKNNISIIQDCRLTGRDGRNRFAQFKNDYAARPEMSSCFNKRSAIPELDEDLPA